MAERWFSDDELELGGLISFVQERLGDEGVADAWTSGQGRGWCRDVEAIANRDRRQIRRIPDRHWDRHGLSRSLQDGNAG